MLITLNRNNFQSVSLHPPLTLLSWLTYDLSLTMRLKNTIGEYQIEVFDQQWGMPDAWDQQILNINNELVFHREIIMWALDLPCWYARTMIPYTTYEQDPSFFNRLKKESLGALIFNEPRIKRHVFLHYAINQQRLEYQWLKEWMHGGESLLWVRLSVYQLEEKASFILIEILLPGLLKVMT